MNYRKAEELFFKSLMLISIIIVLSSLFAILIIILVKGGTAINLKMLIQTPKGGYYLGKEGGIANAIIGSIFLAGGGIIIASILSLPIAFALQKEYASRRIANFSRMVLDLLWGTPSIVYGAFAFVIMQFIGLRASLLGGILVLSLLMMPIMVRAMEEVIRLVPRELKEVSYAMGTTRFETMSKIILRQAVPGVITALLLAFGRGIGDAASILFTAGYTDYLPHSLFDPVASLPLAVFFQISTPIPEVQERAYASALVLLIIVLLTSILSRYISAKYSKYIVR